MVAYLTQLGQLSVINFCFLVNLLPFLSLFFSVVQFHIYMYMLYVPTTLVHFEQCVLLYHSSSCVCTFSLCVCNQSLKTQWWRNLQINNLPMTLLSASRYYWIKGHSCLPSIQWFVKTKWLKQAIQFKKVLKCSDVWCLFFLLRTKWFELTCSSLVCK